MIGYARLREGLYLMEIPKQEVKLSIIGTRIDKKTKKSLASQTWASI